MQPEQQPWKIPKVAQTPKKITRSPPRMGPDLDQLTSSDDDDYIRAFKKTPTMKSVNAAIGKKKASTGVAHHLDDERSKAKVGPKSRPNASATIESDQGLDDGLSNIDGDGNRLIGRFCPFMPVTKFCYKYMDDPNDRVSKHFFAAGKIWNRKWDM
jgi:hypothetical protein